MKIHVIEHTFAVEYLYENACASECNHYGMDFVKATDIDSAAEKWKELRQNTDHSCYTMLSISLDTTVESCLFHYEEKR